MSEVITAEQFREAVRRSARQKTELAQMLGVERTAIYWYEKNGVSRASSIANVRKVMGLWLHEVDGGFDGYSDTDLIRELGRRLSELRMNLDEASAGVNQTELLITDPGGEDRSVETDAGGQGRYTGTGEPPPDVLN